MRPLLVFLLAVSCGWPAVGQQRQPFDRPRLLADATKRADAVRPRPQLVVGGTYYVTASFLNIRSRPVADEPGNPNLQFGRNAALTVLEIPNRHWVLVRHTSEDVSVVGYVSRWYLSEMKVP